MSFIDDILEELHSASNQRVLAEIREGAISGVTGSELLEMVRQARTFLVSRKFSQGDRCGLLAANSIRWIALDIAAIAQGLVVVPLYSRQAPSELAATIRDSQPSLICCGDSDLLDDIAKESPACPLFLFDEIFTGVEGIQLDPPQVRDQDSVTIIYTSGTSGESKGVVLTAANVGFMLDCTAARLAQLMSADDAAPQAPSRPDRIFHYLPLTFAASWIAVLTFLKRRSQVVLNTDLSKIAADMRVVAPDYFLNVPQLLERMRRAVDEQLWQTGGVALAIYSRAKAAWVRQHDHQPRSSDALWLGLARKLIFPSIRKKMIGANLRALICGSAPLNPDTQLYFQMLGIRVLQVYGLTETTAICTMDDPGRAEPGHVGPAIPGIEMKLGENNEIIIRGPNIFPGYWNRPEETDHVLRDGWFHTGDQGEISPAGNWRITGRLKNLVILGSGHKLSPEPIEDSILKLLPSAQQVVIVGNGRGYLSAIVTGNVTRDQVQSTLDTVNPDLPHYRQVRAFVLREAPFSANDGTMTINGKLKRDAIATRMNAEIEDMYKARQTS